MHLHVLLPLAKGHLSSMATITWQIRVALLEGAAVQGKCEIYAMNRISWGLVLGGGGG